jgi:hypothetical protein
VLKPLQPLDLLERERVQVSVLSSPQAGLPDQLIDHAMLAAAQAHVSQLDRVPTHQEVQEALSTIPGSLSAFIADERGHA